MTAAWLAGVATGEIVVPDGTVMCGFAARTDGSAGTLDPLTVRAFALSTAAGGEASLTVVADLTALSPEQARALSTRIARLTGLAPHHVVVAVTHTHAAPQVDPDLGAPAAHESVIAMALTAIVDTASRAWDAREPATLEHARGCLTSVARNRRHEAGPIDPTLDVVRARRADGSTLAVLLSYACHPTVLGPGNHALSADWPGAARTHVEEQLPGSTAIFLQGCCGDTNVGHAAHSSMSEGPATGRTYADAVKVGHRVADAALRALDGETQTLPHSLAASQVGLPALVLRATQEAMAAERARAVITERSSEVDRALAPLRMRWLERVTRAPESRGTLSVTAHRWGAVVVVFLPGEPFGAIAREIRAALPSTHIIVVAYAGGVHGYVPHPESEFEAGGYEVEEAHLYYGRPAAVPRTAGHELVAAAVRAVLDVT